MVYRDHAAISDAIAQGVDRDGVAQTLDSLIRFAVLAFAPSEHGRAALLSIAAASTIHDVVADAPALLERCAIYVADTRAPWSEPPIGDPPALDDDQRDDGVEIAAAIATKDRLRGERWLAKVLTRDDVMSRYFEAASRAGDSLLSFPVAVALWKIASSAPPFARFAILRDAVADWTQPSSSEMNTEGSSSWENVLPRAIESLQHGASGIIAVQRIVALESAAFVERELSLADAARRIAWNVAATLDDAEERREGAAPANTPEPVYPLARDYGGYLQLFAIRRRGTIAAAVDERALGAAWEQMQSESYEEWTLT